MSGFGWKSGPPPWAQKPGPVPFTQTPSLRPVASENTSAPVFPRPATSEIPVEVVAYQCFLRHNLLRMQTLPTSQSLEKPETSQIVGNNEVSSPLVFPSSTIVKNKPGLVPFSQSKPGLQPIRTQIGSNPLSSTASLPFFSVKSPLSPLLSLCRKCGKQVEQLYQEVHCIAGCQVCTECMFPALEARKCPCCERLLSDAELEWLSVLQISTLHL